MIFYKNISRHFLNS